MAHAIFTASRRKRDGRIASLCAFARRVVSRCVAIVIAWQRRRRDRKWLAGLDERALRDLGIDRPYPADDNAVPSWRLDRFTP